MLDRLKTILSSSLSDPKAGDPVVEIEGREIPVRIRRTNQARRISMRADTIKREIRITMPVYAPTAAALDFVAQKRQWIATRFETAPTVTKLRHGAYIAYLGEPHRIIWSEGDSRRVARVEGEEGFELRLGGPEDLVEQRVLRWLREAARPVFCADILDYCQRAGELPPQLAIGDPRSRWGSCSSRGTISLSWRLIMAPTFVRRSVVAHEVAHMRHMDHSPTFYAWFEELFEGDKNAADRWLKAHGTALQLIGR